ncbi:MAG: filamentous hemagglutinin N-terminal domain-containing protein [Kaiparowitsia implicata GSE-PSE-MK54-09C]|nr:filamentous hemagglutinin N-terminal domain-containing protein [Kaiparowitsia implicata GSE-PSE-MK54-09C]
MNASAVQVCFALNGALDHVLELSGVSIKLTGAGTGFAPVASSPVAHPKALLISPRRLMQSGTLVLALGALMAGRSLAQVSPDATLGTEASTVSEAVAVPGGTGDRITGGATRGTNLFHSFSDFNIAPEQRVYFARPDVVDTIITRVTGGGGSVINGTLGVEGAATLFLLNPNGIVFGPGAQLDVAGSVVATTASGIQFGTLGSFGTEVLAVPSSLLTVQPSALLMSQLSGTGSLVNQSQAGLAVPAGDRLLLLAGRIALDGGRLQAPGGRIELAAIAPAFGTATVALNPDGSLGIPVGLRRGDIELSNQAIADVTGDGSGSLTLTGRTLRLTSGSELIAGVAAGQATPPTSPPGDLVLNASRTVQLDDAGVFNTVNRGATGQGGDVLILAERVQITNGGQIDVGLFGTGRSGDVGILATELVLLTGRNAEGATSGIFSDVVAGASGEGGTIVVSTQTLRMSNGAALNTSVDGQGQAGNLVLSATDHIRLDNARIYSQVGETGVGQGGSLILEAGAIALTNGASLDSRTLGQGDAGNIVIEGRSLSLRNNSSLNTSTAGVGNAGFVQVSAPERITLTNSRIVSEVELGGVGNGGFINLQTGALRLQQTSSVQTTTAGAGDAGFINLDATEDGAIAASGIFSNVLESSTGSGGLITLTTPRLSLRDQSQISATALNGELAGSVFVETQILGLVDSGISVSSAGEAGIVSVDAGIIQLRNGQITATAGDGPGGIILLDRVELLRMEENSLISAAATGSATGGSIFINRAYDNNPRGIVVAPAQSNGDIIATAESGAGGEIDIFAGQVVGFQIRTGQATDALRANRSNDISASSAQGPQGFVVTDTIDDDPVDGLVELPVTAIDATQQVVAACGSGSRFAEGGVGELVVTGRGGVPANPTDPLVGESLEPSLISLEPSPTAASSARPIRELAATIGSDSPALVEAQGWVTGATGEVMLVAEAPLASPHWARAQARGVAC